MALSRLGDVIFNINTGEEIQESNEVTNFPVEDGTNVNDNVDTNPLILTFSGIIHKEGAVQKLQLLRQYLINGTLLNYTGRNVLGNVVIESMDRIHDNTIRGGFKYSITIREIQISQLETISVDFDKIFRPVQKRKTNGGRNPLRQFTESLANNPVVQAITTKVQEVSQVVGGAVNRFIDRVIPEEIQNPFERVFNVFGQVFGGSGNG